MDHLSKIARGVALLVLSCGCIAVMCFSFAVLLGLVAVLLVILLTAYALNPKDVKAIAGLCADRVGGWIDQLKALVDSMLEIIRTMGEVARAATQEAPKSAEELQGKIEEKNNAK